MTGDTVAIEAKTYHCDEMTVAGGRVDLLLRDLPHDLAASWLASGRPIRVTVGEISLHAVVIGVFDRGRSTLLELSRINQETRNTPCDS